MSSIKEIENIYALYVDDLYTYASYMGFDKDTIMDAIHDVFCKITERDNPLNQVSDVKFYLFVSLKNRLFDILRTSVPHVSLSTINASSDSTFDLCITIEDDLIGLEEENRMKTKIEQMLGSLTARQREIIYLRYVQEYDYPKISNLLGISISGCRKLVSKGMQSLRAKYGGQSVIILILCVSQMLKL